MHPACQLRSPQRTFPCSEQWSWSPPRTASVWGTPPSLSCFAVSVLKVFIILEQSPHFGLHWASLTSVTTGLKGAEVISSYMHNMGHRNTQTSTSRTHLNLFVHVLEMHHRPIHTVTPPDACSQELLCKPEHHPDWRL